VEKDYKNNDYGWRQKNPQKLRVVESW
jgi:hypothetical protein